MLSWSQSSLLIVAHGSSRYREAAGGLLRLADHLRERALFARVDVAFWRQEPLLAPAQLSGEQIFVLPFFAGLGKHTEFLIPERLGLSGAVTRKTGRVIFYCRPVGCHPALPALIEQRALSACDHEGEDPAKATLLLIAHGSKEGGASATPEAIAAELRRSGRFLQVTLLYLEQEPRASDWPDHVTGVRVIAQPLLLSEGMHASDDIPPLFGMTEPNQTSAALAGHQIRLQRGVGDDAQLVAMMLDQIRAAAPEAAP